MRKFLFLSFLIFYPGVPVWTQNQGKEQPIIRAAVDVVNVVCTVRDRRGEYVSHLKKEHFQVFENGTKQEIDFFYNETSDEAQALTIVLLIDTSGSVKEKLAFEQMAATEFLQQTLRKNKDMAAIVQFDSEINLVQDFTYDHTLLSSAILDIRAGGATKLYDAIWLAVGELLRSEVGRKVVVILSDGADTQSMVTEKEAIRIAQEEDVVIYGIGVRSRRFDSDFGKLEKFAESTGGVFFNSKADLEKLREAFGRINREIKNQYILGYVSGNRQQDGSFRKIRVEVTGSGLKVNHRKGYYAQSGSS
jgi:Ca-activated chloride channel homolog